MVSSFPTTCRATVAIPRRSSLDFSHRALRCYLVGKSLADTADEWPDFRGLVRALDDYEGKLAYRDVLVPWLAGDGAYAIRWLRDFGERAGHVIAPVTQDELVVLYALSRANEALLVNF